MNITLIEVFFTLLLAKHLPAKSTETAAELLSPLQFTLMILYTKICNECNRWIEKDRWSVRKVYPLHQNFFTETE